MNWQVVSRPQVENDVVETADWYDSQRPGLGAEFIEEVIAVFASLEINPLLNCRQHPTKNIRWRYPQRFPYRVIYEVSKKIGWLLLRLWFMPPVTIAFGATVFRSSD